MYGCESWTIKKAECQKIDAFELKCWRRLLRIPWTARRSSQSILEDISPEYSLEGLILWPSDVKKVTHLNVTHFKRPWCWEWLKAGGKGDVRGWDGWMASLTQWTWIWVSSKSWWWTRKPGVIVVHGVAKSRTQLSDWTELITWDFQQIIYKVCQNQKKYHFGLDTHDYFLKNKNYF